uniref:Cytochrome c biogenesis protein CcsA n=1 Tax=Titanophycus setchellii TaxID=940129 RepID=A0A1G4NY65_9FLOR|nr:Cytochrome c biogenesis protein ccs1 [Titanophycus setchellii]SCW23554.1 Cytochrome c biogenesis protein ccs1 [Titanophycus setchellii]
MEWNIVHNRLINISFGLLLTNLLICWTTIAFPYLRSFKRLSQISVTIVNILLAFILASRWYLNGYFPLSNLYESLLFLTWCLTLTQMLVNQQIKSQIVNAISLPIDLFIIAFASLCLPSSMQQANPLVPALHSNWLIMHVTVMILSYAFLLIGSLLSILFLIIAQNQFVNLKGDSNGYLIKNSQRFNETVGTVYTQAINQIQIKPNIASRMNLLESLDNLSYRIIGLGFPLLTVGIISGAVWANEAWGSYWSWDPKETWALITWLVFASYLHSRLTQSWSGKKPAILASIGFFIVWICYLGVNFLGQGLHSYGWVS